jgi:hypothetical protein
MITRIMALLLFAGSVWGCAASVHEDALVRDAFQEREAAYMKLARAMTSYCAIKHPSLEARQACLVDKRLELLHIRRLNEEEAAGRLSSDQTRPSQSQDTGAGGTFPQIRCERAGEQTTCHRLSQAFVEGLNR